MILPSSHQNAVAIAERLKDLQKKQGPSSSIVSVQTIDDFVPKDQSEKIRLIASIRSTLKPKLVRQMSPADQAQTKALLAPEALHELHAEDLPLLIRQKFTEKSGRFGSLVVVEPTLSPELWNGNNLGNFIGDLRRVADEVQAGAPVAGGLAITSDLISSISRDGPRATLLAFISVFLLVILLFRDFRIWIPALFALTVGIVWFGGLIVWLSGIGLKVNFLNFVALPITFGIGVDYGVNVFQRYRQQTDRDIARVVRETGGAVALCSLTTIIGYSSLLMASNQGFVSFGLLSVIGEIACLIAALFTLPAMLLVWRQVAPKTRNKRHQQQRPATAL